MTAPSGPWFGGHRGPDPARPQVVCFPHAGGRPAAFAAWSDEPGIDADVLTVRMPGREGRFHEAAPESVAQYAAGAAEALATVLDRPTVLFGHSLGALVAYETARRLTDLSPVRALVASGCAGPPVLPSARVLAAARLEGRDLAEAVAFFGGLPPEVVDDDDLREVLLPPLSADFRLVAGYRHVPGVPLPIPLHLVAGTADPHVDAAGLAYWRPLVEADPVTHWIPGGHFGVIERPTAVAEVLRPLLRAPSTEHEQLI